ELVPVVRAERLVVLLLLRVLARVEPEHRRQARPRAPSLGERDVHPELEAVWPGDRERLPGRVREIRRVIHVAGELAHELPAAPEPALRDLGGGLAGDHVLDALEIEPRARHLEDVVVLALVDARALAGAYVHPVHEGAWADLDRVPVPDDPLEEDVLTVGRERDVAVHVPAAAPAGRELPFRRDERARIRVDVLLVVPGEAEALLGSEIHGEASDLVVLERLLDEEQ